MRSGTCFMRVHCTEVPRKLLCGQLYDAVTPIFDLLRYVEYGNNVSESPFLFLSS